MAEETTEKTTTKTTTKKELAFKEFINTISISARDKWVLEKMFAKDDRKKTQSAWFKELDTRAEGINYKKI